MAIVLSTLGSPTYTGWKRRSSAASFSMYLRYSSSVVAPTTRSSPHVAGVGRALGLAGPDDRVRLVDEDDEPPVGARDLLQHRLQPLLELAAILGAGEHGADVERDERLVAQALGDVAVDDALRQPLDDRRLADARLADQDRVVLRAAREHLDDAPDLLVAADDRIELATAGALGEIGREAGERLILLLGVLVRDLVRAADGLERLQHLLARGAHAAQQREALGALHLGEREQHVLGGHVLVAELARLGVGAVEHLIQLARDGRLGVALLRIARRLGLHLPAEVGDVDAELLQDGGDDSLVLAQHRQQQVCVVDERVAGAARDGHGLVQRFGGFDGQPVGVQHVGPMWKAVRRRHTGRRAALHVPRGQSRDPR
jgi:hypothetical protein